MKSIVLALLAGAVIASAAPAYAGVIVTIAQSGANVTTATSGSFDLSGLTVSGTGNSISDVLKGNTAFFGSGLSSKVTSYRGLTGPTVFGPGIIPYTATSNKTGTAFVLNSSFQGSPVVSFANTYVSNTVLTSTSTYDNITIAGLGLTEGSYIFSSSNDTITFNIGNVAAAVPEPASWTVMIGGFVMGGAFLRRRRSTTHSAMTFGYGG